MREIIAEFASLQPRPDIAPGYVLLLGREDVRPELRDLHEGEPVLLLDPGNLRAQGTVISRLYPDGRYWFGMIPDMADVEDIHPLSSTST